MSSARRRTCPCCQGEAKEVVRLGTPNWEPRCPYRIECKECGLKTVWCDSATAAHEVWDRRPAHITYQHQAPETDNSRLAEIFELTKIALIDIRVRGVQETAMENLFSIRRICADALYRVPGEPK